MKKKDKAKASPKVITRNKNRYILTLSLMFFIGAIVAGTGALLLRNNNPTVLVWAADKDVKVPDGLVSYLERKHSDDCKGYKGTNSVKGVTLFSVYESSQNRLAKMSYGCGDNLTRYIVGYKDGGTWKLTQPVDYFSDIQPADDTYDTLTRLPGCSFLSEHDFPASFEPLCINDSDAVITR